MSASHHPPLHPPPQVQGRGSAGAADAGPCPCGRLLKGKALRLSGCCGPYLGQPQHIPDAEALMRSRYTAFVQGNVAHLRLTWHASTCPPDLALDPTQRWLGLEVRQHRVLDATHAEVEFVARSRIGGRGVRLHETSRFVWEQGQWWYVDGDLR